MGQRIRDRILQAIQEKIFPGCAVGLIRKSGERLILPFGNFTYDIDSLKVKEDSIFDIASITKSIPTSSLTLKLIDEEKLRLDDKLIDFLPEFRSPDRTKILIKHLLTYGLDFDFRLSSYKNRSADEILEKILNANFRSPPGTTRYYTNATSILLGMVVETILNSTLDKLGEEYFFEPLKMTRTTFWPLGHFKKEEIVPTEIDDWRGRVIQGEVHDESAYAFMKAGRVVGSAGLFSTAPDLLNFLEMFLTRGVPAGIYEGLGWELNQPRFMGRYANEKTFGKTGFTGCVVICDIKKGVGIAMLSNATYPRRKPLEEHRETINAVRRDLADIIFAS